REGVKFHNGEAFNAEAVKFSFDRVMGRADYNPDYKSGHGGVFKRFLDRVEMVDDYTVRFQMKQLFAPLLSRIALEIVPPKYVRKVGDAEFARHPVGTGPFRFVERKIGETFELEAFPDYWNRDIDIGPVPSTFKKVVQKAIPEDETRIAALQTGEVDLIVNVPTISGKRLEKTKGVKVVYLNSDQPMHIQVNARAEVDPETGKPNPYRDKRVRLAMNYAVDLQAIIKNILTGRERHSVGSSSRSLGFPEELGPYPYDPKKAKALLAEAGYPDGFPAKMYGPIGRWPMTKEVMDAVAGYLGDIGIKATTQQLEYQVVTTKLKDRSMYPLCFWGMAGGDDPAANFTFGYLSNAEYGVHFPDPGIDRLVEESGTLFDEEKRAQVNKKIITKFYEDANWLFLYEPVNILAMSDKLEWEPTTKYTSYPEYWYTRVKG
ncbi:MAG: hypothetical protein HY731_15040, partial [Candidatus Tectomicrobia bacterium]|nr:hypothetical protein [Candidatus Tectomicrobia bacterium]